MIVSHADDAALLSPILRRLDAGERIVTVTGGATRQQSVLAGLEALASKGLTHVMIHDAVRPFVPVDMLERIVALHRAGASGVLPALSVTDTLKRGSEGRVVETVSRQGLYAAQTPQSFGYGDILTAHRAAAASGKSDFTDDASIAEWAGLTVTLTEGSVDNVKLTLKRDIAMADEKLSTDCRTCAPAMVTTCISWRSATV